MIINCEQLTKDILLELEQVDKERAMTREEAIRMLSNRDAHGVPCGYTSGYQEAFDMAIEALQAEPVKHGEWEDIGGVIRYGCPFCHHAQEEKSEYCPNCGAKMDKGGDTE